MSNSGLFPAWTGPTAASEPASSANPAPFLGAGPNIMGLLQALRQRWLLASSVGLTLAILAALAAWQVISPTSYVARTLVHVESKTPSIAYAVDANRSDVAGYRQTQRALAKSRLVLSNALNQPRVSQLAMVRQAVQNRLDPVEWLEKEIRTDYSLGTEILSISMTGDDADELKVLVDAVRQAYFQKIVNKERAERLAQLAQLEELHGNYQNTLRRKEQELRKLARTVGSSDLPTVAIKQQLTAEGLGNAQKELGKLQAERRGLEIRVQELQAQEAQGGSVPIPDAVVEEFLRKDPAVMKQTQEVLRLEQELDQVRTLATETAVASFQGKLHAARGKLDLLKGERRTTGMAQMREELERRQKATLAEAQARIAFIKKLEEVLQGEVKQLESQLDALNVGSLDVEILRREVAQVEAVAKKLGEQREALKVELEAPSRVQVLEEASVARTFNERKQILAALGAGLLALCLSLYGVAWLEYRARRITAADDVVTGLGIPLVGSIPRLPVSPNQPPLQLGLVEHSKVGAMLVESTDALRALVLNRSLETPNQVIMVTSAIRGEGKTVLASNLAASIARGRCQTVLVDMDLRRPAIHRMFDQPLGQGLHELLRGELPLASVLRPTPLPGLSIITAGRLTGHPAEVLTPAALQHVLQQLRDQFDHIVLDAPPILPVADALLVGQSVDGVILAMMRGVSRLPSVHAAHQRLAGLGVRILGGVLMGTAGDTSGYDAQYSMKSMEDLHLANASFADIDLPSTLERR